MSDAGQRVRPDEGPARRRLQPCPAVQEWSRSSPARKASRASTPMSAADGAAIQGGVLGGDVAGASCRRSRCPRHRDLGGVCTKVIECNTTIPTKKSQCSPLRPITRPPLRSTSCRASARWPLTTRARPLPARRHCPARRGVPQIEVTFDTTPTAS
ncbi:MAG: Hsp70 family protein [Oscillospiraceae bacterium]